MSRDWSVDRLGSGRVIDPRVWPRHLPSRIEDVGNNFRLAHISEARKATAMRVLESCRLEIASRLALGAVAWEGGGRRHVLLWDVVDFSVAGDGTDLRADWPGHGAPMGTCVPRADLSKPIGGSGWFTTFDPVLHRVWREHGLDVGMLAGPTGNWMRHALGRAFRRYVDWNPLRRAVLRYLRLDPLVISLTRRIFEGDCPTFDDFNWVHRHERELARDAIERPRLLPFLRLVRRVEHGSMVDALEALLRKGGMTPSARRKLERWGYAAFDEAAGCAIFEPTEKVIGDYANLLDRLDVEGEPSPLFAQLAVVDAGPPRPDWFLAALLDEIARLAAEHPDEDPYPVELDYVLPWLASHPRAFDANQNPDWNWIAIEAWQC